MRYTVTQWIPCKIYLRILENFIETRLDQMKHISGQNFKCNKLPEVFKI